MEDYAKQFFNKELKVYDGVSRQVEPIVRRNFYRFTQRLQNSFLTGWFWNYWQHEDTGYITMLPFWKKPGKRWYKCKYRA